MGACLGARMGSGSASAEWRMRIFRCDICSQSCCRYMQYCSKDLMQCRCLCAAHVLITDDRMTVPSPLWAWRSLSALSAYVC